MIHMYAAKIQLFRRYFSIIKYCIFHKIFSDRLQFFLWKIFFWFLGSSRWIFVYNDKKIFINTRDFRAFRIAGMHGSQKSTIEVWRDIAAFRPEVAIDIGANYGEFVVAISDFDIPIFAIEANPYVYQYLKTTCGTLKNVHAYSFAVSDKEGKGEFKFNPYESGSASLVQNDSYSHMRFKKIKVRTNTLDAFISGRGEGFPKSFIAKIDVEGFEEQVLKGMAKMMECADWWYIILEFNFSAIKKGGNDPKSLWEKISLFPGFVIQRNKIYVDIKKELSALSHMPSADAQVDVLIHSYK